MARRGGALENRSWSQGLGVPSTDHPFAKVRPILFVSDRVYYRLGERFAGA